MGSRSTISVLYKDATVKTIYTHWGADINYNGAILFQHYSNFHKINQLIEGGAISILGPEIDIPLGVNHSFNNPHENITIFYARDRKEEIFISNFESLDSYLSSDVFESRNYLFDELKNKWFFISDKKKLQPLKNVLIKDPNISEETQSFLEKMTLAKKLNKELPSKLSDQIKTKL